MKCRTDLNGIMATVNAAQTGYNSQICPPSAHASGLAGLTALLSGGGPTQREYPPTWDVDVVYSESRSPDSLIPTLPCRGQHHPSYIEWGVGKAIGPPSQPTTQPASSLLRRSTRAQRLPPMEWRRWDRYPRCTSNAMEPQRTHKAHQTPPYDTTYALNAGRAGGRWLNTDCHKTAIKAPHSSWRANKHEGTTCL